MPNGRHLEEAEYRALAVAAAVRGARKNGVRVRASDVSFGGTAFAPTRVTVRVQGAARVGAGSGHHAAARVPVRARATAELAPDPGVPGLPSHGSGGGYDGPLAYRQGKPMRPDVALAFDRMAAAAREEAGLLLSISSGFRSDAEQALLFAAHPDPKWVAPPGESRTATPPSSTSDRRPPTPGWRRTPDGSASLGGTPGKRGTTGCH